MCEHKYVSGQEFPDGKFTNCQGDYGPVDAVPVSSVKEKPEGGDVCFHCGQIYGETEGTLNAEFVKFTQQMVDLQ